MKQWTICNDSSYLLNRDGSRMTFKTRREARERMKEVRDMPLAGEVFRIERI